jgi:LPXTG-motif cell wall-anchored protein
MRRLIAIGATTALALLMAGPFAGVANAVAPADCTTSGSYGQGVAPGVVPSAVEEGGVIDVTGCGTPGAVQTFVLGSQTLGTTTTGPDGFFSARLPIPCGTEQGAQTLTISEPGGRRQTAALTVDGVAQACVGAGGAARRAGGAARQAGGGGGALPRTGSASLTPLAAAGVGMVLMGAFAVAAARRRRTAQAIES